VPEPTPVAHYTWTDVEGLADTVATKVASRAFDADTIVWTLRGGAMPGILLSHLLGIRSVQVIQLHSTVDETPRGARRDALVATGNLKFRRDERVLLVDDVTNTGSTIQTAREHIIRGGCRPQNLCTAALLWDTVAPSGEEPLGECFADLWGATVHAWVAFPWEKPKRSIQIGSTAQ